MFLWLLKYVQTCNFTHSYITRNPSKIVYVYWAVVTPTTSVLTAVCETWQRTSGWSTWLLLNRSPEGSSGLYLPQYFCFLSYCTWPQQCACYSQRTALTFTPQRQSSQPAELPRTARLGPFVSWQCCKNECMQTCAFLMSAASLCGSA